MLQSVFDYGNLFLQGTLATKKERKEDKKMRTIIYSVINKETNKKVYANCQVSKCEEYLATLENKENFKIVYRYQSF